VILLCLSVIYITGFAITILHESAHVAILGETPQEVIIGLPILLRIRFRNILIYPVLPICGCTKMELTRQPTKFRMLCFTLSGCIAGVIASISCGFFGYMLLPPEALSRIHHNGHRLGFLLRDVVSGTSDVQTTLATALIISAILYSVQQLGNLAPLKSYDGHNFLRVLRHRQE